MTRLTTRMRVDALMRRVQAAGGFATVLVHGDDGAGALFIVLRARDGTQSVMARTLGPDGYGWTVVASQPPGETGLVGEYIVRQRRYDPDAWAVELDIADAERFVAESSDDD